MHKRERERDTAWDQGSSDGINLDESHPCAIGRKVVARIIGSN